MVAGAVEARAQDTPQDADASIPPGYAEAIHEAVAHYSAGRWRLAQKAFGRAHGLQPSARTYRGLGLSAFYLDEFAAARAAFEQALADTRRPLPDDQKHQLTELLLEATRVTGRIELRITPVAARVELDGVVIEPRVLFVDRGQHVLSVSAEGYVPQRANLAIEGGEQRSLELALEAQDSPATPVVLSAPAPAASDEPSLATATATATVASADVEPSAAASAHRGRLFTWIAAAAVPVFAGTAAVVWLTGKAERDAIENDCARDLCDDYEAERRLDRAGVDAHETWTNVSLIGSGVALVAATVLFFVEGQTDDQSGIELNADRSGALLRGQF